MRSSMNRGVDQLSHGGRTKELAEAAGIPEEELLDFSANINPAGAPPWLGEAIEEGASRIGVYPDPDAGRARDAAALRYGLGRERFVFADGADSFVFALPGALGASSCIAPSPSYSGYLRAANRAGLRMLRVPLDPEEEYSLASEGFARRLAETLAGAASPALVFLGAPNNPAGGSMKRESLLELAGRHPDAFFALDESFAELAGEDRGMIGAPASKLVVLRSLTKTWAVPGARVGFASAEPTLIERIRAELPAWPLSCFAEAIAVRALADREFSSSSAAFVARAEVAFVEALRALGEIKVHRSGANFLLLELSTPGKGGEAASALLRSGIAVRGFADEEGLDGRFLRVAVRRPEENARLVSRLAIILDGGTAS
jgi:histidinol-phosphate/aromatic aminotransferase/cobyric acid decarboxylase-like protein